MFFHKMWERNVSKILFFNFTSQWTLFYIEFFALTSSDHFQNVLMKFNLFRLFYRSWWHWLMIFILLYDIPSSVILKALLEQSKKKNPMRSCSLLFLSFWKMKILLCEWRLWTNFAKLWTILISLELQKKFFQWFKFTLTKMTLICMII